MNIPGLLRLYRDYIRAVGLVRFEQAEQTVYAAPASRLLLRQQKAMELLRHLEVAPQPAPIQRLRGSCVMAVNHHTLTAFMAAWQVEGREARIEIIRRLGATVGMIHSLRHSGTGDILAPTAKPVALYLAGLARKSYILFSQQDRESLFPLSLPEMLGQVMNLWGDSGGTLVGNWPGFPPVKLWDSGLMVMDLSRAKYSEPLLDLVNIHPQAIGLDDVGFFWEYFLQGYGATGELPALWQEKIELLYRINLLQAMASGMDEMGALRDWQSKWWENL